MSILTAQSTTHPIAKWAHHMLGGVLRVAATTNKTTRLTSDDVYVCAHFTPPFI